RADRLARQLRARGARAETLVGIYMDKGVDAIVSVLAVLKTGAAYVPIDRDHSRAVHLRRQPLPILVTHRALLPKMSGTASRFVCIDDQDNGTGEGDIATGIDPDSLAYVIHTSGSTGEPKRVMVSHGALASAWRCWEQDYALSRHADRCLQMASFGFDVFTADLVRALCSGGTLVLCRRETLLAPDELYSSLRDEQIGFADFVPAVLHELVALGKPLDFLRVLIAGSSVVDPADYQYLLRTAGPRTQVVHAYGVTEATIDSTAFTGFATSRVPIGRPVGNTRL
ncbi:AMP-binding protein, partial [Mesorhizobium mediterraneum]|uniref:AMP-binding protein n=1 Tax=Mesorhizobium mediterraneum TaxID=43617 RepID=UPI001782E01C